MSTAWQQLAAAELETSAVIAKVGRGALCTVNVGDDLTALCKVCGRILHHSDG